MSELETGALGPGRIESRELEQEMRSSFLDYAMSVIVSRALPGRARRAEAGAPPRPLLDVDERQPAGSAVRQEREHRRLCDGQLSPARRPVDLRHARADGAAVLAALPARRRPGQLRLDRRRPAGRDALHRGAARAARRGDAQRARLRHGRLRAELRRVEARSARAARALPEPARQRQRRHRRRHGDEHPAAQPERGDRRDRDADRQARRERRGPDEARERPRLPDRRDHRRPLGHSRRLPHGPRPRRHARARPHRGAARRQERDHRHASFRTA